MRMRNRKRCHFFEIPAAEARLLVFVPVLCLSLLASAAGDELSNDATWSSLRAEGQSFVFGRLEGRFDGPDYRARKIRVRHTESGEDHLIEVEQGLGYFDAVLPAGFYEVVAIEAIYLPSVKPMKPERYPPVRQRYALKPPEGAGLPTFPAATEMPVYLGTIRSGVGKNGIVYEGHRLEIADEFDDAWAYFSLTHPGLARSLGELDVTPRRYFFVRAESPPSPLEAVSPDDPLGRARDYIEEGKYEQAVAWLATFLPTTDGEREAVRLLVGEALLADGQFESAIEELGQVLLANPENMRALRLLARAHAREGNYADADGLYRALATSVPGDAEASLYVGYQHALSGKAEDARSAFDTAFEVNFDYLLHDLMPYALAIGREDARYEPPQIRDGLVKPPSTMRSRRGTRGGFALLIDHQGRVIAAHLTPDADSWAPATLMSVVRARFKPARLNDVPIPCLVILGIRDLVEDGRS